MNAPESYGVRAHIQAWRITADNLDDVAKWAAGGMNLGDMVVFDAPDGRADTAEIGDWVLCGTTGEFFTLEDRWFREHYYREDPPPKVTHGCLTGDPLRIVDRRDGARS